MKTLVLNFNDLSAGKTVVDVKKAFARVGTFVVTVESDNKIKKSSGVEFKTLDLSFNDGQKVSMDAKKSGDVFAVKINGSVLPIKNHENLDKAIVEIVNALDKNRAKFQKKQSMVKVELPKGLKSTSKKQAEVIQETIASLDTKIEEATAERDALKAELALDSVALDGAGGKDAQIGQIETYMNKLKKDLEGEGFNVDVVIYRSGKGSSRDVGTSYGEITITDDGDVYEYFKYNANGYAPVSESRSGTARTFSGSMAEMKSASQKILDRARKEHKEWLDKSALDYAGQPRDTDGTYAEGKQGSLKAGANKVRFAVKKAFGNPFRK